MGCQFEPREQVCCRLVETATDEVSFANSVQIICHAITRAEAQAGLEMLEREIGLTAKTLSTPSSANRRAWLGLSVKATVDQPDRGIERRRQAHTA